MNSPSTILTNELPLGLQRIEPRHGPVRDGKVECNACPVLCQISEGRVGACDRYANHAGLLVRLDPVVFLNQRPQSTQLHPLQPRLQARPIYRCGKVQGRGYGNGGHRGNLQLLQPQGED